MVVVDPRHSVADTVVTRTAVAQPTSVVEPAQVVEDARPSDAL
jgi:hypothetical protein